MTFLSSRIEFVDLDFLPRLESGSSFLGVGDLGKILSFNSRPAREFYVIRVEPVGSKPFFLSELEVTSEVKEYFGGKGLIGLSEVVEQIIDSVRESVVNAETGETLYSKEGWFGVKGGGLFYICSSDDVCIEPINELLAFKVYRYVEDVLGDLFGSYISFMSAARSIGLRSSMTKEVFRERYLDKIVRMVDRRMRKEAYSSLVKSLRENYGFDCRDENNFTVCEYVSDTYDMTDPSGKKIPVRKVFTIKIKNPNVERIDYQSR